jgi:hypothetical protein
MAVVRCDTITYYVCAFWTCISGSPHLPSLTMGKQCLQIGLRPRWHETVASLPNLSAVLRSSAVTIVIPDVVSDLCGGHGVSHPRARSGDGIATLKTHVHCFMTSQQRENGVSRENIISKCRFVL